MCIVRGAAWLTPLEEAAVREALTAGGTACAAAAAAGVPYHRVKTALYESGQLADIRVGQGRRGRCGRRCSTDPTEEEIEAMALAIRCDRGHFSGGR